MSPTASRKNIELSICGVVWNDLEVVKDMLDSIFEQRSRENTEVLLVDNASTDGTLEYLREREDVTLIENGINVGYPVAMNRAARAASGEFVMLCNPDLIFRDGSLQNMLETIQSADDIGGVSPVIEIPTEPIRECPLLKSDPGILYGWNFFSGMMAKYWNNPKINKHFDYEPSECKDDIPWIHGCCGMFRKEALEQVGGGFDELFFLYFEDADLGRSIRKNGWKLKMATGARVLHLEDQSCKRIAVPSRQFFMESWHKYHRKHSSLVYRTVANTVISLALCLQMAVQLAKLPFGKATNFPVMWKYFRVHCRCLFVDLAGRRKKELARLLPQLKALPKELLERKSTAKRHSSV